MTEETPFVTEPEDEELERELRKTSEHALAGDQEGSSQKILSKQLIKKETIEKALTPYKHRLTDLEGNLKAGSKLPYRCTFRYKEQYGDEKPLFTAKPYASKNPADQEALKQTLDEFV